MSNQQRDKEAQTQQVDDRERDATMAPTVTEAINQNLSDDDQEDHNITEKSTTAGSLQINDCKLSGCLRNVSKMKEILGVLKRKLGQTKSKSSCLKIKSKMQIKNYEQMTFEFCSIYKPASTVYAGIT
nr:uncharacterized protein LOC117273881 [Nicotiana tomentosiformis]